MPRKKAPKANLTKDEKAAFKAIKKASNAVEKRSKKAAHDQLKAMLVEWCATPGAEFPRAD